MTRQWFAASLLFENASETDPATALWEDSIVLIEAEDEFAAQSEAARIGQSREVSYRTSNGGRADWRFRHVERVYEIGEIELKTGMEVFSRFLRSSEVESLLTPFQEDAEDEELKGTGKN